MRPSWTNEEDDSHPNHRFLEPNVENNERAKCQSKKKKERKNLLLPTVWKGDLSKNTSIPQSLITPGLHAHIHAIALKSLN